MLDEPKIFSLKNPHMGWTLEGIKKHQVIAVEKKESKVEAICEIIKEKIFDRYTRTIIIFSNPDMFYILTEKLMEQCGPKFSATREGMDQNARDLIVKEFLEESHLLITILIWARDMVGHFCDNVHSIINYDTCNPHEYMQRLGWLRGVATAITFVDSDELEMLLDLQESFDLMFERLVPSEFPARDPGAEMIKFDTTKKQYILNAVKEEDSKVFELENCRGGLLIDGGTIVMFVKSVGLVSGLVEAMKKMFTDTEELVIISDISEVLLKMEKPCVFVTADDDIINKESNDDVNINEIKKNVHVVINYDIASSEDDYRNRFGWCKSKNGVIIHLVTDLDWFKVVDLQSKFSVRIAPLPCKFLDYPIETYQTRKILAIKRLGGWML